MRIALSQLFVIAMFSPLIGIAGADRASPGSFGGKQDVLIAAAADLKFAMDSVVVAFSAANPDVSIQVVYGSSGNFFQQIGNGAPFDLFFSADVDYPKQLREKGLAASEIQLYGIGQLVLWSLRFDPAAHQMNSLLEPSVRKVAIANPGHAPYGRRAEECLRYYQLYDKIRDKLVFGENIGQTAEYARSGAADAAIVALSLALSPEMQRSGGRYWLIPAAAHQPLEQGFILLPHGRDSMAAHRFMNFLSTSEARAILKSFGFSRP
ncbi:MAG TPA: molybdate ABC transporter substrate-binding protein [Puia sp.]|nr:molybdate ABC transporter substrate-binding protein [Puia sp.]